MPADAVDVASVRRRLGPVGVWNATLGREPAAIERAAAAEIEVLGYGALWFGETPRSKEALTHAAILLQGTERLTVATGIANIWVRDATAMANGANALAEAHGGRFLLGMGVSHAPLVRSRGHVYASPLEAMRSYLDEMDTTRYEGPLVERPPRMLAALRDRMLELAAQRTQGAHTYFVTPLHTSHARSMLGPDPVLAPEQALVFDTDPVRARRLAREYMAPYLDLPNYRNNLLQIGWSEDDLDGGGTDALVDAIVVWGDEDTIASRVRAHHQAGADHVCVQPLAETHQRLLEDLRALAPALVGPPGAR